ncbi:MAG: polysaccharide deacetylase family protein [Gammaproteobacteria bacterium]|nr:polysaccharide deacetylase family protein [Gammaproteobacteria bacterium]
MMHLPRWLVSTFSKGGQNARLRVLMYHRVIGGEPGAVNPGLTADQFQWQMEVLNRHFNMLPLSEAVRRYKEGTLPSRAACVSFDDGFSDTLHLALPIAQKVGVPIAVFVTTRYLNGGIMFNDSIGAAFNGARAASLDLNPLGLGTHDLHGDAARIDGFHAVIDQIKYRSVDERLELARRIAEIAEVEVPADLMLDDEGLRALHQGGAEIGSHTHSHPILSLCSDEEARWEIEEGKRRLEAILGVDVRLFAYPNGKPGQDYGPRDVRFVSEAGFDAAFTTGVAADAGVRDVYQIPRFTPWDSNEWRFVARLLLQS